MAQFISGLDYGAIGALLGVSAVVASIIITVLLVWTLAWKGVALWKAARKHHLIWFIVLLIVNTLGILEILYIFVFSKMTFKKKAKKRR